MNIQPKSKELRKYIPTDDYFASLREQKEMSFIGEYLNIWADEVVLKRIKELEGLEDNGFVFLGEKNWLQQFLNSNRSDSFKSYDQWVIDNFNSFLGINFEIDREYPTYSSDQGSLFAWKTIFPAHKYLLGFEELNNPAYCEFDECDEFELYVGGNEDEPSRPHICALFEALHNLEYSISTLSSDTRGYAPLDMTGIDVSNNIDPSRWIINVRSEYGAEFYKTILNGTAWRR